MNKGKLLLCLILCGAVILLLPLLIDWLIIGNSFPSHISNSDWVGFLGSYIGTIISCIISLVGIIWTIRFTRKQNRADRELQIRPYFDIVCSTFNGYPDAWKGYIQIVTYSNLDNTNDKAGTTVLYFKNVGQGSAINVNFVVSIESATFQYEAGYNNQNALVSGYSVSANERAAITIDVYCNRPVPNKELIEEYLKNAEQLKTCYPDNFIFIVQMTYGDLLGNSFNQKLKFKVTYGLKQAIDDEYVYECDINIIDIGDPEKSTKPTRQ